MHIPGPVGVGVLDDGPDGEIRGGAAVETK
jgi:hypothetical protein